MAVRPEERSRMMEMGESNQRIGDRGALRQALRRILFLLGGAALVLGISPSGPSGGWSPVAHAATDDAYEPNDSPGAAVPVSGASMTGLYLANEDWFQFDVRAGSSAIVRADFAHPNPNLGLQLLGSVLQPLATSDGYQNFEQVSTGTVTKRTRFFLRVYFGFGSGGVQGSYSLSFTGGVLLPGTDASEPNDSLGTAASLAQGVTEDLSLEEDDFYSISAPPGTYGSVKAEFNQSAVDLNLELLTSGGVPISTSNGAGSSEILSWDFVFSDPPPGDFLILRIHAASGSGPYRLTLRSSEPLLLAEGTETEDLALMEDDYFKVPIPPGTYGSVRAVFDQSAVNLDLEMFQSDGAPFTSSTGSGSSESIDWNVSFSDPSPADFLILHVYASSGSGSYDLTFASSPVPTAEAGQRFWGFVQVGGGYTYVGVAISDPGDEGVDVTLQARWTWKRFRHDTPQPDIQVRSGTGTIVVPFETGRGARKTKVQFTATEPGTYLVTVWASGGGGGDFKVTTKARRHKP